MSARGSRPVRPAALFVLCACAALSRAQEHFKLGLLAPWNGTFEDFSALTSASAVSLSMERIHEDPTLGNHIKLR